jgi:hypothetical protein
MIKKTLIPALALLAASVALPAAAQPQQGHGRPTAYADAGSWNSINARQANLDRRIDQGVRSGSISRREATRLRGEFGSLVRLEASYRRGGLSRWERDDLNRRFDRLAAQIRSERRDRDNRRG